MSELVQRWLDEDPIEPVDTRSFAVVTYKGKAGYDLRGQYGKRRWRRTGDGSADTASKPANMLASKPAGGQASITTPRLIRPVGRVVEAGSITGRGATPGASSVRIAGVDYYVKGGVNSDRQAHAEVAGSVLADALGVPSATVGYYDDGSGRTLIASREVKGRTVREATVGIRPPAGESPLLAAQLLLGAVPTPYFREQIEQRIGYSLDPARIANDTGAIIYLAKLTGNWDQLGGTTSNNKNALYTPSGGLVAIDHAYGELNPLLGERAGKSGLGEIGRPTDQLEYALANALGDYGPFAQSRRLTTDRSMLRNIDIAEESFRTTHERFQSLDLEELAREANRSSGRDTLEPDTASQRARLPGRGQAAVRRLPERQASFVAPRLLRAVDFQQTGKADKDSVTNEAFRARVEVRDGEYEEFYIKPAYGADILTAHNEVATSLLADELGLRVPLSARYEGPTRPPVPGRQLPAAIQQAASASRIVPGGVSIREAWLRLTGRSSEQPPELSTGLLSVVPTSAEGLARLREATGHPLDAERMAHEAGGLYYLYRAIDNDDGAITANRYPNPGNGIYAPDGGLYGIDHALAERNPLLRGGTVDPADVVWAVRDGWAKLGAYSATAGDDKRRRRLADAAREGYRLAHERYRTLDVAELANRLAAETRDQESYDLYGAHSTEIPRDVELT